MAAMTECLMEVCPPRGGLRKGSPDPETDSGVDNTSDLCGSCDDLKNTFSSTESLDTDQNINPGDESQQSVFAENERVCELTVQETVHVIVEPLSKSDTGICKCQSNAPVAVLELEPSAVVDPYHDTSQIDMDQLPAYFQDLWLGKQVSTDFGVPIDIKPSWFDEKKFKRGQKFAQDHLFCINFAESLSLFLIFALKSALEPLIFTERSGTPYKAFQRYLSTLTRIMSWYEGDPWKEGSESQKHMTAVRVMHRSVKQRLESASSEELKRKTTMSGEPIWSKIRPIILEDFRSSCPMPAPGACPFEGTGVWVNQFDMAVTQFAFVGLVVTYPKKFGIHYATDEDLEGFIHLWRSLGHLLGIEDKYNYCNTDLEAVRQRTHDFINLAFKPSLRNVTPDWEHMCRCLVRGIAFYVPGFDFDVSLKYLCSILMVHTPRLSKSLGMWQSFMYRVVNVTYNVLCRIPGMLSTYNWFMLRAIRRAQQASPDTLRKWEQTEFSYLKQGEKGPIAVKSA